LTTINKARSFLSLLSTELCTRNDPPVKVILAAGHSQRQLPAVADARQQIEKFLRQKSSHLSQPMSIYLFTNDGLKFSLSLLPTGTTWPRISSSRRAITARSPSASRVGRLRSRSTVGSESARLAQNKRTVLTEDTDLGWPWWPDAQFGAFQVSSSQGQQQLFDSIVTSITCAKRTSRSTAFHQKKAANPFQK